MLLVNLGCRRSFKFTQSHTYGSLVIFNHNNLVKCCGLYCDDPLTNEFQAPIEIAINFKYRQLRDLTFGGELRLAVSKLLTTDARTTIDDNLIQKLIAKVG